MKGTEITLPQIIQSVMVLAGSGQIVMVQEENVIARAKKTTDKLNNHIMSKAAGSGDITYLASPVTGGGITVGRFQQLFLLAMSRGKRQPSDCAQFVWQILAAQGQKIVKEGKPLETGEENIKELTEQAVTFFEKQLPILKALQIA